MTEEDLDACEDTDDLIRLARAQQAEIARLRLILCSVVCSGRNIGQHARPCVVAHDPSEDQ